MGGCIADTGRRHPFPVLSEFLAADATRLDLVKRRGETRVAGQVLLNVLPYTGVRGNYTSCQPC